MSDAVNNGLNCKRIGIVTYHRTHNYGTVLQAYALLTFLKQSYKCEIVDYWPDYREGMFDLIDFRFLNQKNVSLKLRIRSLLVSALKIIQYSTRKRKFNRFQSFVETYLEVTGEVKFTDPSQITGYDCYIYGSDQIWRWNNFPTFVGFDYAYWGDHVSDKKVAYAASMGVINNKVKEDEVIIKLLEEFDHIAVREDELKDVIKSFSPVEVNTVLDPVFLIRKTEWNNMCSNSKLGKVPENYILLYNLTKSKEATAIAEKLAEKKGLQLIEISGTVQLKKFLLNAPYQDIGPIEFIQLIKNASYVVSSSFHGVAFSILFEKQFYAVGMKNNSGRVGSLLRVLNIQGRLIAKSIELNLDDIDYSMVNENLNIEIEKSRRWLIESIEI